MTCDCCKCHAFFKRKDLETKACPQILDPPGRLALPVRHRLRLRRMPGGLGWRASLNPLKITNSFKDDPDLGYHIRWLSSQLKSGHPLRQAIKW